jgi:glycosyltransferase involved in cell wall biosynthesis
MSFSIVICTYNPKPEVFQRLLNAIVQLSADSPPHEVLLVDNNSNPPLSGNEAVQIFLRANKDTKLITQKEPGLTAARRAGIHEASYDWLVFFDDDNEPAADYLLKASEAIKSFPQTAAWGAAEVEVEFIGDTAPWLNEEKLLFQQRHNHVTTFDNQQHWQDCYPFGTGLIIKKQICQLYEKRVAAKRYTLTDRKGKSLASGGDVQLVLTGIEQGFYAGIIGGLKMRHLIDTSKASLKYLQKLQYGTASAYVKAYNEVFIKSPLPVEPITNGRILLLVYSLFRIYKPVTTKERFRLLLASKMGELNARAEITPHNKPFLLKLYERMIDV